MITLVVQLTTFFLHTKTKKIIFSEAPTIICKFTIRYALKDPFAAVILQPATIITTIEPLVKTQSTTYFPDDLQQVFTVDATSFSGEGKISNVT